MSLDKDLFKIDGFENRGRIPQKFAFGVPTDEELFTFGPNISPAISWSDGPEGTMSYAVIMHDASVPTVFDDANQEGKTISADLPFSPNSIFSLSNDSRIQTGNTTSFFGNS